MKTIQTQKSDDPLADSPLILYAVLFIIFGAILAFNFIRPIFNLYTIYFEINWAEFHFLELFDILNFIFGILLVLLGFVLLTTTKFNRGLLIFAGILFLLFNILDPTHFLMFGSLISLIIGTPPVWMQVINPNLFVTYISTWSLLSISNLILQLVGLYIAIRIILNSNPKKGLITYLFYYCWVLALSGVIFPLQSIIAQTIMGSWGSIAIAPYVLNLITWLFMFLAGISGLIFITYWRKNHPTGRMLKFGQITLICYSVMFSLVSFSDIEMKTILSLVLTVIFSLVLAFFALKLRVYLKEEKKNDRGM